MTEFAVGTVVAGYVSLLIEWLKTKRWFPFAQFNAFYLNIGCAAVASLLSIGALSWTFSDTGDFQIIGNIYAIRHGLYLFAQQYILQHFWYKNVSAPPPTPVLTKAAEHERDAEARKG